jgi:hypothetical protein
MIAFQVPLLDEQVLLWSSEAEHLPLIQFPTLHSVTVTPLGLTRSLRRPFPLSGFVVHLFVPFKDLS